MTETSPLSTVIGDFSTDLIKFDLNDNTNEYLNTALKDGLMPTILLPTRVTNHACTLSTYHIYYYLSRNNTIQIASGNLMTDMSVTLQISSSYTLTLNQKRQTDLW